MVRLFNVYFPTRSLVRLLFEALLIGGTFLGTIAFLLGPDMYIELVYKDGLLKVVAITIFTLLLSYYFDLYEPQLLQERWETYFRLLLVLSTLSFFLAGLLFLFPNIEIGHNVFAVGVFGVSIVLLIWRRADEWFVGLPIFRERVYVMGCGSRARAVVEMLRIRRDAGIEVVGWTGQDGSTDFFDRSVTDLRALCGPKPRVDRVIVALEDRRGSMPISDLLNLRLAGVSIEDASAILERLTGTLPLEGLSPSTLIFSEGFKIRAWRQVLRRLLSILTATVGLLICLPFIPLIVLAVRLSSPGPVFFRQTRVGRRGRPFTAFKFRTMRQDAEAAGAVWASKNDPRITRVGGFMRKTRLDEIPQLWNVLRGDMAFVGPRPERPEFVQWLSKEIPYYDLRHMIRPGITGWAQVRYQYGATLEETKQKLEYDLYYLKHISIGLDLLIMFETIKTIVLRRGAQ